jgi:hypothetical protein
MVKKPQLVPPPPLPEYWAHHRVLSQGRAEAGVRVSTDGHHDERRNNLGSETHPQALLLLLE